MDVMTIIKWGTAIFLLALEATIILMIWLRRIDLQWLISEESGAASLSRFQFLVFTFVIVSVFLMMAFSTLDKGTWPDIPNTVLGLLGISGGSYVVSKGIQKSAERSE